MTAPPNALSAALDQIGRIRELVRVYGWFEPVEMDKLESLLATQFTRAEHAALRRALDNAERWAALGIDAAMGAEGT